MPLRGDESYVRVDATLAARTPRGVKLENDAGGGWIARQCLHFASDKQVDDFDIGDDGEWQVMAWAAEKAGLA